MLSLVKAISKSFKGSKSDKTDSSLEGKQKYESKESNVEQLENNIDLRDSAAKSQARFNFLYIQVERMVEQLGNALHFKEKMTEEQKRQLIYELSSMAMDSKKLGTQLMDEDVLSADSQDEENDQNKKQVKQLELVKAQPDKEKQCEAPTQSSEQVSQKSMVSPEKQLKELFQEFERNQEQAKQVKGKDSWSSFGQIKAKMSSFFMKNSSKVFKVLKTKGEEKGDKSVNEETGVEVGEKKKKKSFISSILPSWNGKKDCKYGSISSSSISEPKGIQKS